MTAEAIRNAESAIGNSDGAVDSANPWPGLAPFTEDQSAFFYGRDEEIRALARLMERKALTVLFGQSGLGKSSLLQAGVFPRLRAANFCPVYIRLDHNDGAPSPTEQVKALVAAETARAGTWTKPGSAKSGETLWEFFHHRDDRLADPSGRTIVPVIVFDQFEELFTLGAAAGAQRDRAVRFMSELAELVENRPSEQLVARLDRSSEEMDAFDFGRTDYRVCISLREDYLPHLEGLKTIMPALMENRMRLSRMTGTQALDAVLKPGGQLVTPEVARAIVEFVAGARGGSVERLAELDVEPPLLSVICRELNDRRRALGSAQITADLVTGNRREILHDFYERSVADLPGATRRFVEDKLLTKSGFRDNLALETALEEPGVTRPLIDTLVSRRLLRIEDRIGTQRVELTHDVLAEVVRAARDERQQRVAMAAAVRESRRQRRIISALAGVVAVLCVGAGLGLRAQRRAERARREEAAQSSRTDFAFGSQLLGQGRTPEGLAYLVRAARSDPSNHSVGPRLISALVGRSFAVPLGRPLAQGHPVAWSAYSPDGKRALTASRGGMIVHWDVRTGQVLRTYPTKLDATGIRRGEANHSLTEFALPGATGAIWVWRVDTGQFAFPPLQVGSSVLRVAYSPDDRWLVAVSVDNRVRIWNANTGQLKATIATGVPIYHFGFDPASSRIVVTTHGRGTWRIWRIPGGEALTPWARTPNGYANFAAFSPDGRLLAVTDNGGAQLYDAATGVVVGVRMVHAGPAYGVGFSHDGRILVTTSNDATVRLWHVPSGAPDLAPLVHGDRTYSASFSFDDHRLLTACEDGVARLWDVTTGRLACEPIRVGDVLSAELSPDGSEFITGGVDGMVRRWSTEPGAARALVLSTGARRVAFAVDSRVSTSGWAVSGNQLQKLDLRAGRAIGSPRLLPRVVTAGRLSPGAKKLVVRIGGDGEVWDLQASPVRRLPLEEVGDEGQRTWITSDSHYQLGLRNTDTMRVWDLDTGRLAMRDVAAASRYFGYCPATRRLALAADGTFVQLYDLTTGRSVGAAMPQSEIVNDVAFTPDGRLLACGTVSLVQLWNANTQEKIGVPIELRGLVRNVEFSDDGRRLLTGTPSETRVWDVATGRPLTEPMVGGNDIMVARFLPGTEGKRIATISRTTDELRIWDAESGELISEPMHRQATATMGTLFGSGRFMVFTYPDQRAQVEIIPVPPPALPVPAWLLQLATTVAGGELDQTGVLRSTSYEASRYDDLRRTLAALPDDSPYSEWGRWFLADRATRSIAPGFTITAAEADRIGRGTQEGEALPNETAKQ